MKLVITASSNNKSRKKTIHIRCYDEASAIIKKSIDIETAKANKSFGWCYIEVDNVSKNHIIAKFSPVIALFHPVTIDYEVV